MGGARIESRSLSLSLSLPAPPSWLILYCIVIPCSRYRDVVRIVKAAGGSRVG